MSTEPKPLESAIDPAPQQSDETLGLLLEPLDVLFVRDGRPFGAATRGRSMQMPLPQTLAGAIWTALLEQHGCNFRRLTQIAAEQPNLSFEQVLELLQLPAWIARVAVRGPWLARILASHNGGSQQPEVLVPVPAVLQREKKAGVANQAHEPLVRLSPMPAHWQLPGWNQTPSGKHLGLRPLWHTCPNPTEPVTGLVTLSTLEAFLQGNDVCSDQLMLWDELAGFDHRTGIGVDPQSLVADEGLIYAASFLALGRNLQEGWRVGLYAEVVLPDGATSECFDVLETLQLGGEGRRVSVTQLPAPVSWPDVAPAPGQHELLVLTTPAVFCEQWRPEAIAGRLVAAAVPEPLAVSGWDMARGGPKPTRFAAPAGSVYYLEGSEENLPYSLADDSFDRQQGWGCFVRGTWTDE